MSLGETIKNLRRTREIIQVLVKYGFEDMVSSSTLRNFVPESSRLKWLRQDRPALSYTSFERIRMAAEELGPTFVKLAQILSIRPDILPEGLIKELEKLQDKVAPFSFVEAREIIEEDLGMLIEEAFDDFQDVAIASASIGQVHKAKLKGGQEVVVKVQRPNVKAVVERDLAIIVEATRRAERYLKRQGMLNPKEVVRTFQRSILKELDYQNEARNIEKFKKFYGKHRKFYVPGVYREMSSDRILVIEYAKGCKITDAKQQIAWGVDPKKTAENGMFIYLTQIFEYGYFHADPHPGNVLVRPDGVICLIDFGMVGRLMPKDKVAFAGVFISIAQRNAEGMANSLKTLAISHEIDDMRMFQYELNELIEDYADLDVGEGSIADMSAQLQKIMYDYRIAVPGSVFLIFRALAILEGIGKQIHPTFNTYDFIKPFGKKIFSSKYSPKNIISAIMEHIEQDIGVWRSFPNDFKEIITKFQKGQINFKIHHQGYGYLLKKLDSLTNRITLAMIIVAMIIGSSITMLADFEPYQKTDYGVPYVSLWGIIASGVFFIVLVYAVLRRRRYK